MDKLYKSRLLSISWLLTRITASDPVIASCMFLQCVTPLINGSSLIKGSQLFKPIDVDKLWNCLINSTAGEPLRSSVSGTPLNANPRTAIVKRILEELKGEERHPLFVN